MKQTLKEKLIDEALDFYKIDSMLDNDDFDTDEDFNVSSEELPGEDDFGPEMEDDSEFWPEEFGEDEAEADMFSDEEDAGFEDEPSNPDKEGLIRTVRGAYMVYKRATAEGNFEELWLYNMGNVKTQTHIRNAILAGTDIDPITLRSPTNDQTADVWSKGNVQYLHVNGLPN